MEDSYAELSQERSSILYPPSSNGGGGRWSVVGGRLYRTGDLARWRPDGTIAFLGRIDHQVKLHGHRIELNEIDLLIGQHPGVHEVVSVVREDSPGDTRLVSYIVPNQEQRTKNKEQRVENRELRTENRGLKITDNARDADHERSSILYPPSSIPDELRTYLRERLPDYMVPSAFVILDALPLTPNGKVNRRALPAPDGLRPEQEVAYVAPQSEVERMIAQVWEEILQVRKVGVHDNFFEVGGSSLLVVQVHSKLHERIGRDIPMAELFRHPTISALAQFLSREQDAAPARQQIQDRAQRQTQARQTDAISRQRQFMEQRRNKA